jgi:hypothetical protein
MCAAITGVDRSGNDAFDALKNHRGNFRRLAVATHTPAASEVDGPVIDVANGNAGLVGPATGCQHAYVVGMGPRDAELLPKLRQSLTGMICFRADCASAFSLWPQQNAKALQQADLVQLDCDQGRAAGLGENAVDQIKLLRDHKVRAAVAIDEKELIAFDRFSWSRVAAEIKTAADRRLAAAVTFAGLVTGRPMKRSLTLAAIAVQRQGAGVKIGSWTELESAAFALPEAIRRRDREFETFDSIWTWLAKIPLSLRQPRGSF